MSAMRRIVLLLVAALAGGLTWTVLPKPMTQAQAQEPKSNPGTELSYATFAGGCFWCMEGPFDKLDGVVSTTSGYAGGELRNPTYEQVSRGGTGHAEVVQIAYDATRVSYQQLLDVFWRNIDPFAVNRQFCDAGPHYRSAIFFHDERQRDAAQASREQVAQRFAGQSIATEIASLDDSFYPAEEYHQDYYLKNPIRYRYYRGGCGRDDRLEEIWGKSDPGG